jgi:hypothetical protein
MEGALLARQLVEAEEGVAVTALLKFSQPSQLDRLVLARMDLRDRPPIRV